MKKKGQITLFIILGIFILLMTISLLFLSITTKEETITAEKEKIYEQIPEAGQVKELIDNCLEKSTMEGLLKISSGGGYIDIPPTLNYNGRGKWFIDQINVQPTLEEIKVQLEQFIEQDIKPCLNYSTFEEQGFEIVAGVHNSEILFGGSKVVSNLKYTLEFTKGEKTKEFNSFLIDFDLPFRKMFETASTIINLQQETDFERLTPLEGLNSTMFTIQYSIPDDEHLIYSIVEKNPLLKEKVSFEFSSEFGRSYLKKTIELAPHSNTVPTYLPLVLRSIDKMLKLYIMPETTMNLRGLAVPTLSVQQTYPLNVTRENIPISRNVKSEITYGDIHWNLTYPVYSLGPAGVRFNEPQRLVIYWDEDEIPHQGKLGLLYGDDTGWRALPAKVNYTEHYVYTDLPGFGETDDAPDLTTDPSVGSAIAGAISLKFKKGASKEANFTIVSCDVQDRKQAIILARIEGGTAGCVGKLIAIIIVIIIIIVICVVTFGGGTPLAAGVPTLLPAGGGTALAGTGGLTVTAGGTALTVTTTTAAGVATSTTVAAGSTATVAAAGTTAAAAGIGGASIIAGGTGSVLGTTGALMTAAGAAAGGTLAGALATWGTWTVALVGGLVGGMLLNGAMAFEPAGINDLPFTPNCDQNITVYKEEYGGDGICTPKKGEHEIKGGIKTGIQAKMQSCNFGRAMFCVECSVKCRTSWK